MMALWYWAGQDSTLKYIGKSKHRMLWDGKPLKFRRTIVWQHHRSCHNKSKLVEANTPATQAFHKSRPRMHGYILPTSNPKSILNIVSVSLSQLHHMTKIARSAFRAFFTRHLVMTLLASVSIWWDDVHTSDWLYIRTLITINVAWLHWSDESWCA